MVKLSDLAEVEVILHLSKETFLEFNVTLVLLLN